MTRHEAIEEMIQHASRAQNGTTLDLLRSGGTFSTAIRFNGSCVMKGKHDEHVFSVESGRCIDTYEYKEADLTPEDWQSFQDGKLVDDDAVDALAEKLKYATMVRLPLETYVERIRNLAVEYWNEYSQESTWLADNQNFKSQTLFDFLECHPSPGLDSDRVAETLGLHREDGDFDFDDGCGTIWWDIEECNIYGGPEVITAADMSDLLVMLREEIIEPKVVAN